MFEILFTKSYNERAKRFLQKHPAIKKQYAKTMELLSLNPWHPSLRLHKFTVGHTSAYSISINMSYRISLDIMIEDNCIIPLDIGTHQDIYGK